MKILKRNWFFVRIWIQKNNICIDFSLTRNLAYYDGLFLIQYKNELIGGGGKYDDLPKVGYKSDYSCLGLQ